MASGPGSTDALVIGLDLGTTNCKAIAVDEAGKIRGFEQAAWPMHTPEPGAAEQDASAIIRHCLETLARLSRRLEGRTVAAMALSGAMHTLVAVDGRGRALAPATTWADTRAADFADALAADPCAHELYHQTGCRPAAIYHPARLRWLASTRPGVFRRAARFVAIKDLLLFHLTGRWVTDRSLASSTGLLDLATGDWDRAALCLCRLEPARLCELADCGDVVGPLDGRAAEQTGLPAELPIVAGASDGALSNAGAGALRAGQVVVNVGTSGAIRVNLSGPWLDAQARTWCYRGWPSPCLAGGAINNAGLMIQWLVGLLGLDSGPAGEGYGRIFEMAATVGPGSEGALLLPYLTGERNPHWQPRASAAVVGLHLNHGPRHLARAGLEAVAFCLADVWQALRPAVPRGTRTLRVTGSITRHPVWLTILADVLGKVLEPVEAADASAYGAAMLAHSAVTGTGTARSWPAQLPIGRAVTPDADRHHLYRRLHERFRAEAARVAFGQPQAREEPATAGT